MAEKISPLVEPQPLQWVGELSEIEMGPEVRLFTMSEYSGTSIFFKEGNSPHAQDDPAPQATEDSVVLNLEDALSRAYEEIAELRRRVLELEAQASELLKSDLPQGKFLNR